MQVRLKSNPGEIIVYREKWGTLAFGMAMGLVCVAFGVGFFSVAYEQAGPPRPFVAILCGIFVLAGLAVLVRLPQQSRQLFADDGMPILVANASGLTLSPNLGSEPLQLAWNGIAEIVVAEKMRIVDSDETSFLWREIVVYLSIGATGADHWWSRAKNGINLSGTDRPFVLVAFPRGQGQGVCAALRKLAPDAVQVHHEERVVFDRKASTDTYS